MRFKTPIILAVVLLALGGLATWDEWQTEKEEKAEEQNLTALQAGDVAKIIYADKGSADATDDDVKGATDLVLEKLDGTWRITSPREVAADQREVEDFIKTVLDYKYERVIVEQDARLEEFRLDKPQRSVTLQGEKGEYVLHLGSNTPVGYSNYFRIGQEDKVYTGSQYVLTSTQKSLFDLRDKKLIKIDAETLQRITFWHQESQVYEVTRQEGKYQLLKPSPFKTSQEKVSEYVEEFNQVRVEKFFDTPEPAIIEKFKTADKIIMTAVFEFSSGETKELKFVRDRGELLVAFDAAKIVFGLPKSFEEKVRDLGENFRDHSIFSFIADDVTEIVVDGESYRRHKEDWYRRSDLDAEGNLPDSDSPPSPADSIAILLDSLETAEALGFTTMSEVAKILATAPARKIILTHLVADATQTLEISFWEHPEKDDRYYLTHSDSDQVFFAPESLLEGLTMTAAEDKQDKKF